MATTKIGLVMLAILCLSSVEGLSRHRRMCGSKLSYKIIEICTSVSPFFDPKPLGPGLSSIVTRCCVNACSDEDILEFCISKPKETEYEEDYE